MKPTTIKQDAASFTKGEWEQNGWHLQSVHGWHIAEFNPYAPETINSEANLKLCLCAPAMYEALQMVLWDMENGEVEAQKQGKPRYSERKEIIEAIINSIEGNN